MFIANPNIKIEEIFKKKKEEWVREERKLSKKI
jgi:hypothetical protein